MLPATFIQRWRWRMCCIQPKTHAGCVCLTRANTHQGPCWLLGIKVRELVERSTAKCLLCTSTGGDLEDPKRVTAPCAKGPEGAPPKTTPLPLSQCPRQLICPKRKWRSCLPPSVSGSVSTLSDGILRFRLRFWNLTAAGYWKMQVSHTFRIKMQHSPLSQQEGRNTHVSNNLKKNYNSKICSLEKNNNNPSNRGGNK